MTITKLHCFLKITQQRYLMKGDIVNMWRARLRTKRCKLIVVGVSAFYIMEGGIVLWLCW